MEAPGDTCQEIDAAEVHFLESIGKGSFGVVYKALWRGLTVAVKKVETESEVNAFHNEVQQLCRVQHENIIYLYGACTLNLYKCLVMEYADGGSLYHLLHNSPSTEYNLAHSISWLSQCAKAVSYLHSIQPRPLLHRDLKPPNLLLTKGAKVLKVCDFGTACELSTNMTDNRGSAAWMAPEVFEGKVYTEKCDVYSWGIMLWEVLTRRVPFQDLGLAVRIMWAVHQRQRPPLIVGCPKLLENLMKRCWDHNQARRPRMEEVVEKVAFVARFLKGGDDPINNPPSDDSITDSYMSPCVGSSACHTSRDVSEIATTSATTASDRPHQNDSSPRSPHNISSDPSSRRHQSTSDTPSHHHHHHHHHHQNAHDLPSRPHKNASDPSIPVHNTPDIPCSLQNASDPCNPCHRRTHHNHDNNSSAIHNEDDSICSMSGSEGMYQLGGPEDSLCSTGSSDITYPVPLTPAPAPPVSPNSSQGGLDNLSLSGTGLENLSLYRPLVISIPNPSPPSRHDLTPAPPPRTPTSAPVRLRQHLSPGDPDVQLRRRSAEVPAERHTHLGHRRSSSYGTSEVVKQGEGEGQEEDPTYYQQQQHQQYQQQHNYHHHQQHHHHHHHQPYPSSTPPPPSSLYPAGIHIPQYQIDPSLREPGGSLGAVENALKYPDITALRPPLSAATTATTTTTTTMSTAYPSWLPYPLYGPEPGGGGNHNGENVGGGGEPGSVGPGDQRGNKRPDEEELGPFWDFLEAELTPSKPLPSCPESQNIFSEHKEMAGRYLVLQTEIFDLRQRKTTLEEKLSQAEKLDRLCSQRYNTKIREVETKRDQLRHNHTRLRQQLEQIKTRQEQEQDNTHDHNPHHLPLTPP